MRNFDLQTVSINGDSDFNSAFYINKYLYKLDPYVKYMYNVVYNHYDCPERGTSRYTEFVKVWNLFRPRARKSLRFGFPDDYINLDMVNDFATESLARGLKHPCYISPYSGTSKPLAPYYRQYVAPSLLDKFAESELLLNGFITNPTIIPKNSHDFDVNLFDFTDML